MPFCDKNSHSMQIIPFTLINITIRSNHSTPATEGEFAPSSACKHYLLWLCPPPLLSAENLDRSVLFICGNGINRA